MIFSSCIFYPFQLECFSNFLVQSKVFSSSMHFSNCLLTQVHLIYISSSIHKNNNVTSFFSICNAIKKRGYPWAKFYRQQEKKKNENNITMHQSSTQKACSNSSCCKKNTKLRLSVYQKTFFFHAYFAIYMKAKKKKTDFIPEQREP